MSLDITLTARTDVAHLVELHPAKQKVDGSIPSQGATCRWSPVGGAPEATD